MSPEPVPRDACVRAGLSPNLGHDDRLCRARGGNGICVPVQDLPGAALWAKHGRHPQRPRGVLLLVAHDRFEALQLHEKGEVGRLRRGSTELSRAPNRLERIRRALRGIRERTDLDPEQPFGPLPPHLPAPRLGLVRATRSIRRRPTALARARVKQEHARQQNATLPPRATQRNQHWNPSGRC
jgi:hypothetical protein